MALPKSFFSPCQEPPYRISGSIRQFHWKGCLYGAHILGNGRCSSYTPAFHKSFPAQWTVAYLNDILSREATVVIKHSHPQHSLPVYSYLNAAVFNSLVHWNKIIRSRLAVWAFHRLSFRFHLSNHITQLFEMMITQIYFYMSNSKGVLSRILVTILQYRHSFDWACYTSRAIPL